MITLKTLPQATEQEVFDQAASHILRQNKKSLNPNGIGCAYRGNDGLKCAAGCFISDDEYKPAMDSYGMEALGLGWDDMINEGFAPTQHNRLINELQGIHDIAPVDEWKDQLERLANRYNLQFDFEKLTSKLVE